MHSLHAQDFKPMHSVWDHASTGYKASSLGDKAAEAGEYLSNKYEIQISPNISIILRTKNNFATARRSSPSVFNS